MYEELRRRNIASDIFTFTRTRGNVDGIPTLPFAARIAAYDLLIHHYWDSDYRLFFFTRIAKRAVLKYHNITPPHFFEPYARDLANAVAHARAMLPRLASLRGLYAFADSHFNKAELVEFGMPDSHVSVVPPFHSVDDLYRLRPSRQSRSLGVLTVGRIAPNKGLALLLESFGDLVAVCPSKLHIVGTLDARLTSYKSELDAIIKRRGLTNEVVFHGTLSQCDLATLYHDCDVFVTCSQHEGFCVPVIEAMAFSKPTVAWNGTALPETCGTGGVLVSSRTECMEAMFQILSNKDQALALGARGRAEYEARFAPERIQAAFAAAIDKFL